MSRLPKNRLPWPSRTSLWVLAWAVYTLSALGWFGYQDALVGFMCLAPR